jgi:fibro-slime domain-containing protein
MTGEADAAGGNVLGGDDTADGILVGGDDTSADGTAPPEAGGSSGEPPIQIVTRLPTGFRVAEGALDGTDDATLRGGFDWVGPLADLEMGDAPPCANILRVLVRDFETFSHPDFGGSKDPPLLKGLVEPVLGDTRKPTPTGSFPGVASALEEWYTNVEGVNMPHVVDLWLEPAGGKFVFDSTRFFPLDEVGVDADVADRDNVKRNFSFTTELHTKFEYKGGETFLFRGDDDVFVFVDGQLVVDLGGVHNAEQGDVRIDDLNLTVGEVYTFDLFQAERNPNGSNFRLETTLDFTECGEILPSDEFE